MFIGGWRARRWMAAFIFHITLLPVASCHIAWANFQKVLNKKRATTAPNRTQTHTIIVVVGSDETRVSRSVGSRWFSPCFFAQVFFQLLFLCAPAHFCLSAIVTLNAMCLHQTELRISDKEDAQCLDGNATSSPSRLIGATRHAFPPNVRHANERPISISINIQKTYDVAGASKQNAKQDVTFSTFDALKLIWRKMNYVNTLYMHIVSSRAARAPLFRTFKNRETMQIASFVDDGLLPSEITKLVFSNFMISAKQNPFQNKNGFSV